MAVAMKLRGMTNTPPAAPLHSDAAPSTAPQDPPAEPLLTSHEAADACEVEEADIGVYVARGDLVAAERFPLAFTRIDLARFLRSQGHQMWAEQVIMGERPVCRAKRAS
jgi:hypothetical protein